MQQELIYHLLRKRLIFLLENPTDINWTLPDKIPDLTNLAVNASLNAKINQVKGEIPSITNLATTAVPTTFENKIPDLSKYFITPEFNKLTAKTFTARLAQANLASKNNIAYFVKRC